jgi:hypothetical protein
MGKIIPLTDTVYSSTEVSYKSTNTFIEHTQGLIYVIKWEYTLIVAERRQ